MSALLESYRKNAEASLLEAERAALPNVRRRATEAASIWTGLADKLEWVETQSRLKTLAALDNQLIPHDR